MSLDESFLFYCLDQLQGLEGLRFRKMFGGAGIYTNEVMFALVSADQLYFRVSQATEERYIQAGMGQFVPYPDKPKSKMPYFEVPLGVIERPTELRDWALEAYEVAVQGKSKKR